MRFNRRHAVTAAAVILSAGIACDTQRPTDESGELWNAISPQTALLRAIGATVHLSVVNAIGAPVTVPGLTWRSTEPQVVQVDGNGHATAMSPGTARVIAETATRADTATIEVRQDVATVTVTPSPATVKVSATVS